MSRVAPDLRFELPLATTASVYTTAPAVPCAPSNETCPGYCHLRLAALSAFTRQPLHCFVPHLQLPAFTKATHRAPASGNGNAAQAGVHSAQQQRLLDVILTHDSGQGQGAPVRGRERGAGRMCGPRMVIRSKIFKTGAGKRKH